VQNHKNADYSTTNEAKYRFGIHRIKKDVGFTIFKKQSNYRVGLHANPILHQDCTFKKMGFIRI
jgi:hypothetical protein